MSPPIPLSAVCAQLQAAAELGCTVVQAQGEADGVIASLARDGHVFAAVSDDGDMLARGCPRLIRIKGKTMHMTLLHDVLTTAGVDQETVRSHAHYTRRALTTTHHQFCAVCTLAGCDYMESLPGVAFSTALTAVKLHGLKKVRKLSSCGACYHPHTHDHHAPRPCFRRLRGLDNGVKTNTM